jgi:NAD(P)-dependent dehydrogenase (short-subunit alcohol dehydrogenase family)
MSAGKGKERIAVVTGASRGAGKGIALALGETGATVYVTGRSTQQAMDVGIGRALPGTIYETAELITKAGGVGVPMVCDHADDEQVKALFARVEKEHGYLDILVNNAAHVSWDISTPAPFWERSLDLIDTLDVGVRSTYIASFYAAKLLIASKGGLVANTSGYAGGCYLHGPAYGCAKAAVDKMSYDMGIDFRPFNVCAVSLWMGLLSTERAQTYFDVDPKMAKRKSEAESPKFIGRVVDALHRAPDRMERSAKVWIATELGLELGVKEDDGSDPVSKRSKFGGPLQYNAAIYY